MAFAIPILMIVGTAVSVLGAIQQGKAAKAASEFNAQVAEQDRANTLEQTSLQARQAEREGRLRLGKIRAAHGASGGVFEGSVLDVLGDVAQQNELERQDILVQGQRQAAGLTNQASLDRMQGKQAVTASRFRAGSELISGAVQTYGAFTRV
jgi:hypothetical protein